MGSEEDTTKDRRTGSVFERHLQTGLVLMAVMGLGWVGLTTNSTSTGMATLNERVDWMGRGFEKLELQIAASSEDRYTRQDAQRDYTQGLRRFEAIENRIKTLESAK